MLRLGNRLLCLAQKSAKHHIAAMTDSRNRQAGNDVGDGAPCPSGEQHEVARRIRSYQRQLRRLASELSLAEARERREIASDLHDHVGQALAYVSQKLNALRGNAVFSGMEDDFAEILSILDQTIRYTRDLTVEISPPVLYELGLAAAVDWLSERAQQRHGLTVNSKQSGATQQLPDDIKVFLFKAVQELIANVAKHAQAKRATVRINWLSDGIVIVVSDDGCGFDAAVLENDFTSGNCFGLFSIKERLSYIGGSLEIESTPGQGAKVTISTPYSVKSEAADD